jgi:hypothetical protein
MNTYMQRRAESLRLIFPMMWHWRMNRAARATKELAATPFRAVSAFWATYRV